MFKLDGRVALITGGSKGLGKAIGEAFAEAGAGLCIVSRNSDEGKATAQELASRFGQKAIALSCDVADSGQVEVMTREAVEQFGRIDILVNSAGINIRAPVEQYADADWHAV